MADWECNLLINTLMERWKVKNLEELRNFSIGSDELKSLFNKNFSFDDSKLKNLKRFWKKFKKNRIEFDEFRLQTKKILDSKDHYKILKSIVHQGPETKKEIKWEFLSKKFHGITPKRFKSEFKLIKSKYGETISSENSTFLERLKAMRRNLKKFLDQ